MIKIVIDKNMNLNCLRIGKINRFGEIKELNCIDYSQTEHCKKFNPEAKNYLNFCYYCKKSITICECGCNTFNILNGSLSCSKCRLISYN